MDPVCREPFDHEEGFLVPHFRRRFSSHIWVHISAGGHRIFLQPELVRDLQVGVYFPSRLGCLLCQLRHHGGLCWGGPGTGQTTGAIVVSFKLLNFKPMASFICFFFRIFRIFENLEDPSSNFPNFRRAIFEFSNYTIAPLQINI